MDDEDVSYVRRRNVVHYGSLAEAAGRSSSAAAGADDANENIQRSSEYLALEEEANAAGGQAEILKEFERRKRARLINVSTDDAEVKNNLRELGEPICLFGEGPADRRNRLRELFSQLGEDAVKRRREEDQERQRERREHDETTWYHEGPVNLREARLDIARYVNCATTNCIIEAFRLADITTDRQCPMDNKSNVRLLTLQPSLLCECLIAAMRQVHWGGRTTFVRHRSQILSVGHVLPLVRRRSRLK